MPHDPPRVRGLHAHRRPRLARPVLVVTMTTWTDPLGAVICTRCGHYAERPSARPLAEQRPTVCQCQEEQ